MAVSANGEGMPCAVFLCDDRAFSFARHFAEMGSPGLIEHHLPQPPFWKNRLLALFWAFLLGALTVLGFAPFYLWFLPVLSLAALFGLWLKCADARHAAWVGFAFGLGMFGFGVSWIYVALDFGEAFMPIRVGATALFCGILAAIPAAIGWLQAKCSIGKKTRLLLLIPALWVLAEWLRQTAVTGFPWLALGYSQMPGSPLAGFAPIFGVLGVSLTVALSAALLALVLLSAGKLRRAVAAGLCGLWVLGAALQHVEWTSPTGGPLTVSLLQGNITQDGKFNADNRLPTLATYRKLVLDSNSRLIVMPETALPMFIHQVSQTYLEEIAEQAKRNGGDILIGALEYKTRQRGDYFSSIFSLGTSPIQVYRKRHLVPFGEYVPFAAFFRPIHNRLLRIAFVDTSPGPDGQPPFDIAGQRVGISICYEEAFGDEISQQLPEATLLVNASNDAWYGDTIALEQHLQISQARALETGRYMLRATNTGITAIIDERGNIVKAGPRSMAMALHGQAQGRSGSTPYVVWRDLPTLVLCLTAVFFCFVPRKAKGRRSR